MAIQDKERERFVHALRQELGADGMSLDGVLARVAQMCKDAERINWLERQHLEELSMQLVVDAKHDGQYYVCGDSNRPGYGPSLRDAIDAAMGAD